MKLSNRINLALLILFFLTLISLVFWRVHLLETSIASKAEASEKTLKIDNDMKRRSLLHGMYMTPRPHSINNSQWDFEQGYKAAVRDLQEQSHDK